MAPGAGAGAPAGGRRVVDGVTPVMLAHRKRQLRVDVYVTHKRRLVKDERCRLIRAIPAIRTHVPQCTWLTVDRQGELRYSVALSTRSEEALHFEAIAKMVEKVLAVDDGLLCSCCSKFVDNFSKRELKKRAGRRCRSCVERLRPAPDFVPPVRA